MACDWYPRKGGRKGKAEVAGRSIVSPVQHLMSATFCSYSVPLRKNSGVYVQGGGGFVEGGGRRDEGRGDCITIRA